MSDKEIIVKNKQFFSTVLFMDKEVLPPGGMVLIALKNM